MTLQTSGAISLANIQTEFGGSNPISVNEYYRGGGLVPDTPTNSSIPTSGQISFSNFYGAASSPPSITLSAPWDDIILSGNPPPLTGLTGARTLSWTGGGSRTLTLVNGVFGNIAYSIGGAAYVNYTGSFVMSSSGLTLQFRYTRYNSDEFGFVSVLDETNSNEPVGAFQCQTVYTGGF